MSALIDEFAAAFLIDSCTEMARLLRITLFETRVASQS